MPDPPNYNTRLRTHSQLHLPRRLRPSPSPPPRHRPTKVRTAPLPQPQFPPPHVVLHPDDALNRTFLAIGRALLAVDNRAITIKDLSHLTLDYGLFCQNASAASQAITTFIRNHLQRCHLDCSPPLLLSLPLTGTSADDRLAPALHSRSGGNSSHKDSTRTLTSFRRGTTVWYLSESAGAPCPFQRAGLSIQDITSPAAEAAVGTKRKRETQPTQPRKLSTPGPAMVTRQRIHSDHVPTTPTTASRLRVRLTLKPRDARPPSPTVSHADSSESELTDIESLSDHDAATHTVGTDDRADDRIDEDTDERIEERTDNCADDRADNCIDDSTDNCIDDSTDNCIDDSTDNCADDRTDNCIDDRTTDDPTASDSDPESSIQVDAPDSPRLPPYPILSPSIPSPSCSTPTTSLASPLCSDPFASYRSALCSGHMIKSSFASFRTALSNPPRDHRARSSSLPFSAASPPPDSEDEDEDYHNSMVGLRSAPIPMKQEEFEEVDTAKYEHVPQPLPTAWRIAQLPSPKLEHSQHDVSTPLEGLPGFVSFSPKSEHVPIKDEPTSAVLPPDGVNYNWSRIPEERARADDVHRHLYSVGSGTREDPVRIDAVVHDVEVLGPESVISREWDVAWSSGVNVDICTDNSMDVDASVALPRPCTPLADTDVFARSNEVTHCASPAGTLLTASTSISSPPSNDPAAMESDHESPILMHPLRSCDPPVVATLIEGIPVYHTHLAPGVPFLRRIDTSFVNLTPLMTLLALPLSALVSYTQSTPRMTVSHAPEPIGGTWVPLAVAQGVARHAGAGRLPPSLLDVFLSADLDMWFPDALGRLMQLHVNASTSVSANPDALPPTVRDVGIRVEDVFVGVGCVEFKQDVRHKSDVFEMQLPSPVKPSAGMFSRGTSLYFEQPRSACASLPMPIPLNEQEERLFHSFVDLLGTGVSTSSSPLSSAPSSPIVKPVVTSAAAVAAATTTSSAKEKENAGRSENAPPPPAAAVVRRKREKAAAPEVPVRRSKRALGAKPSAPVTRSRTRTVSGGRALG